MGNQIEVWRDAASVQFVELNASGTSRGIEQKIASAKKGTSKAGTYVLSWRDLCRNQSQAGDGAYKVHVFAKPVDSDGRMGGVPVVTSPKPETYVYKPHKQASYKQVKNWPQQFLVFTLTEDMLKNYPDVWIAFEPQSSATYGAFIAEVSLTPVGIVQPLLTYEEISPETIPNDFPMTSLAFDGGQSSNTVGEAKGKVTQGSLDNVSEVRFSRWWGAYPEAAPYELKKSFIKDDPDRFVIRIPASLAADKSEVKGKLSTKAPSGLPNASLYGTAEMDITLTKIGQWFESNPMILVTNQEDGDDSKTGIEKAQNNTERVTIVGWMGGKIELGLPTILTNSLEFKIAKANARLTIQTAVVDTQGAYSAATVKSMQAEFQREAKEIFAQELIDIEFDGVPIDIPFTQTSKVGQAFPSDAEAPLENPEDRDIFAKNLYLMKSSPFGGFILAPEAKGVLGEIADIAKWKKDAVRVVFVPFDTVSVNQQSIRPLNHSLEVTWRAVQLPIIGFTMITNPALPERIRPNFSVHDGTILMSSNTDNLGNPRVLAHELCHVVTKGSGHAADVPDGAAVGGGTAYPFHRLLISRADYLPLLMKRFSPAEDKNIFEQPVSFLKSIKP